MIEFIVNNYGSIIVGAVVLVILAAVAIKLVRDKKNGKTSCSCGCDGCPGAAVCHQDINTNISRD